MADSGGDSDVNLNALQRVDPYIVEIVDSATQVALYRFNAKDNEWDKTGVEGTLFVYNRSAMPLHGFVIMNRLSKTNQIEPITKDLELQREDPYLLYRNSKLNIFGIWFYGKNDCAKINDSISRLLLKEKDKHQTVQRLRRASESDFMKDESTQPKSVDIYSLLSKAQSEYSKTRMNKDTMGEPKQIITLLNSGTMTASDLIKPKAVRVGGAPDVTRTSPSSLEQACSQEDTGKNRLEALFASATKAQQPVHIPNVESLPSTGHSNDNNKLISLVQSAPPIPSNPVLMRLMSNPEHLVEHIERKQRNEVPVSAVATAIPTVESLEKDLKEKLKLGLANQLPAVILPEPVLTPSGPDLKPTPPENQMIFTPAMLECILPNLTTVTTPKPSTISTTQIALSPAVVTPLMFTTPSKPPPAPDASLMSPMFSASRPSVKPLSTPPPPITANSNGLLNNSAHSSTAGLLGEAPTLTKSQMTEAFIYLLKNDSEFGTKLYDAYIKCAKRKL